MRKRGQIWVETVVYTLIAFSLMGLVLAFVVPKIAETQDKGIIEQSIGVLNDFDSLIGEIGGPGNQRILELGLQKGYFVIDGLGDKLSFEIESRYEYSEEGKTINIGSIEAYTEPEGNDNIVFLTLAYSGEYNITYDGKEESKVLSQAPTPYTIIISNKGQDNSGKPIINIEVMG